MDTADPVADASRLAAVLAPGMAHLHAVGRMISAILGDSIVNFLHFLVNINSAQLRFDGLQPPESLRRVL